MARQWDKASVLVVDVRGSDRTGAGRSRRRVRGDGQGVQPNGRNRRGEIEALQDGVTEPTPAALASLREETLRLGRLVDDLETLARADAAGFSLQRAPTSLDEVVREVAAEYAPIFAGRGIDLRTAIDGQVVADVDPVRIRQVVTNLLSNAAKFTPEGGQAGQRRARGRFSGHRCLELRP